MRGTWWMGVALIGVMATACVEESKAPEAEASRPEDELTKGEVAEATQLGKADFSLDVCERRGWYGDGVCDWFCFQPDPDCELPPLGPEPSGESTRHPIVLTHGFDASPTNRWGFYGVAEALEADGHTVFVATVPPYDTPENRAMHLADAVDEALERSGAAKVNLIAHSMGGLDSRVLISGMGYGDRVASLTTISSPHGGTAVADVALKLIPGAADEAINALATLWGKTYSEVAEDSDLRGALAALAEASAPAFTTAAAMLVARMDW